MATKKTPFRERFWRYVDIPEDPEGCWTWTGCRNALGYGRIGLDDRSVELAHRVSWIIYHDSIPFGKHVLHKCNNGAGGCVNPEHLYLGGHLENARDRVRAGNNALQKIKAEQVPIIKARLAAGELGKDIASDYGVSPTAISRINTGQTFANIK